MQNHDLTDQASDIEKYDLAQHIRDLDEIGLTIVPPAKLGLTIDYFEQLRDAILRVASERTGVMFDLDKNPTAVFNGRKRARKYRLPLTGLPIVLGISSAMGR